MPVGDHNPTLPSGLIFRINDNGAGAPDSVKEVFLENGWIEFERGTHDEGQWNLWWRTNRFKVSDYDHIASWQRINHFPKTSSITRKDSLARLLKLQKALYGSVYNFLPASFILPNDYRKFVKEFDAISDRSRRKVADIAYWICKPADLSRGRGIFIIRELSELQYDSSSVVQQYISRPYLIGGYKFDMRIYVVVVSYHPLCIYLYNDGLVRFTSEKYDLGSLGNQYSHLTNTSINKYSPSYTTDKVGIGSGSKWTITQLRHYFYQNRIDDHTLWWNIVSIINLTIIPQTSEVPQVKNCFELYGFDILIDDSFKPWLLEVNFSPSLACDCDTDIVVKKKLLSDMLELHQFLPSDRFYMDHELTRRAPLRCREMRTDTRHGSDLRSSSSFLIRDKMRVRTLKSRTAKSACMLGTSLDGEESEEETEEYSRPSILSCSVNYLNNQHVEMTYEQITPIQKSANGKVTRPSTHTGSSYSQPGNPASYAKPWRQVRSREVSRATANRKGYCDRAVVGGYHRIYPLNKTTHTQALSPRQMVHESSTHIRSKINAWRQQCAQSKSAGRHSYGHQRPTTNQFDIKFPFPSFSAPN